MNPMQELYEKVAKDATLQAKFHQIMNEPTEGGLESTDEKLVAFAKEAGYVVSIEEVREYFEGQSAKQEEELSDAELDQVAGGKTNQDKTTYIDVPSSKLDPARIINIPCQ